MYIQIIPAYLRRLRKTAVRLALLLIVMVTPSGCGWGVCPKYGGPSRSLEEVAVLFSASEPIHITQIDGNPIDCLGCYEYHLEPGLHTITAYLAFETVAPSLIYYGEERKLEYRFEKGYVYKTQEIFPEKWEEKHGPVKGIYGNEIPGIKQITINWQLDIKKLGTVEERAPLIAEKAGAPESWRQLCNKSLAER